MYHVLDGGLAGPWRAGLARSEARVLGTLSTAPCSLLHAWSAATLDLASWQPGEMHQACTYTYNLGQEVVLHLRMFWRQLCAVCDVGPMIAGRG